MYRMNSGSTICSPAPNKARASRRPPRSDRAATIAGIREESRATCRETGRAISGDRVSVTPVSVYARRIRGSLPVFAGGYIVQSAMPVVPDEG